ncbi:MAG: thermonuclease family protein [Dehalococcoidia bacterium]
MTVVPRFLLLISSCCALAALTVACSSETTISEEEILVTRVVDGDTIEIEGGEMVRYIGIDTPEIEGPYTSLECFGQEASEMNRQLVEGKRVSLAADVENRDKYGRLLRYVYVDDLMVNAELVRLGYAHAVSYPPNTRYVEMFSQLEHQAREKNRGLWNACDPAGSWQ